MAKQSEGRRALERVAELEAENAKLREQLAAATAPKPRKPSS